MKLKAPISLPALVKVLFFAGAALIASCEKYAYEVETIDPEEPVLFQTQIQPIFTSNCVVCHKASRAPDLREGNSFTALTEGGYVTLPAESSILYTKLLEGSHKAFTLDIEKQLILTWIRQGAQNN
jgi:mono/diheme cytochrome c family protein